MKNLLFLLIFLLFCSFNYPQQIVVDKNAISPKKRILLSQEDILSFSKDIETKILSGKLIQNISEKNYLHKNGLLTKEQPSEMVVVYVTEYPSFESVSLLKNLGIRCYLDVWTPPLKNYPYGFFLPEIPVEKFNEALSLSFIRKVDTAEYENFPHNSAGVISINADDVWTAGYDGTGVKVAVLDSGIDTYYEGTEFPSSFERMDYSNTLILLILLLRTVLLVTELM